MYLFFYTIYTIKINVDNFQEFSVYLDCGGTEKNIFFVWHSLDYEFKIMILLIVQVSESGNSWVSNEPLTFKEVWSIRRR